MIRKMLLVAVALAPFAAQATDGYFSHGYGMKSKGRAGASAAMTDDAFGGANNPATMVFAGGRMDLGIDWFRPDRSASRTGSFGGAGFIDGAADGNGVSSFLIPEFGYNRMLSPDMSLGITVYGNGGMNTEYPGNTIPANGCGPGAPPSNLLCGSGKLGVDLSQLIFAPTLARKIGATQSLGVSPLIAYQRFKAYGLQPFAAISSDPNNLTNRGYDDSWGFGVRFGYFAQLSPALALGAAYSTKIDMQEFKKYRGLFAEQGDFDIPENYSLGLAFKANPQLTLSADYKRINYSKVASVGNSSKIPGAGAGLLGAGSGSIGFGWEDVNVFKLGVEYQWSSQLLLRAGYNVTDNPVSANHVTFNILAPGVVEDHLTLGFTYALGGGSEITMAYMHAFKNSVTGPSNNPNFPTGGATETISLAEDSIGISWGKKF